MRCTMKVPSNYIDCRNTLREAYFGVESDPKEYTTSYIFAEAVERFDSSSLHALEAYFTQDSCIEKVSQTITLRQHTYDKLERIAEGLHISPAKALRLIVMHATNNNANKKEEEKDIMKEELLLAIEIMEKQIKELSSNIENLKTIICREKGEL